MTTFLSESDLAANWPYFARLKPSLRSHISVTMQDYRQQRWYVLQDALTGRHTRVNALAYGFLARLDGSKTVEQVLLELGGTGESALTQGNVILLLLQLQKQGGMLAGTDQDAKRLWQSSSLQRQSPLRKLLTPLAIRLPLLDPDSLLDKVGKWFFPLYGSMAFVVWCVLLLIAGLLASLHWEQLQSEFSGIASAPHNWLIMWLVYPVLKVFHEFSHAIMVKRGGGEVHEMGVTLLVFTPVPYVDASSAWSFRSRSQRMMVSAVGIMAELSMASLALLFWVFSEAGFLHDLAFVVMLVGSFSTVAFNANPLLKFDGYYILQDWLEIPNLYQRAQQYLLYLLKRYVLGVRSAASPVLTRGESTWFVFFGIGSLIYRNLVMLVIALWLLDKLLVLGIAILLWVVFQLYLMPLLKALRYLATSPELQNQRWRRSGGPLAAVAVGLLALTLVPVSYSSRVQGIVWVSDQAQLYAGNSGEVVEVFAQPGQFVEKGDAVLQLAQPSLVARIKVLQSRLQAHRARSMADAADMTQRTDMFEDDIAATKSELTLAQLQQQALLVRAQVAGTIAIAGSTRLLGRFFRQGDLIGHVVDPRQMVIRVVVPEHSIGAISDGIVSANVRLAERIGQPLVAFLTHETPSANNWLPSAALGTTGGGGIAIAADDETGTQTRDRVFHLELSLAIPVQVAGVGERAFVSLRHQSTPLADRFLKSTRQLFLKHLPDYAG